MVHSARKQKGTSPSKNDKQSQDDNGVLITELKHTHGKKAKARRRDFGDAGRYFGKDGHNLRTTQVSKVEDEVLRWPGENEQIPLPLGVNLDEIAGGMAISMPNLTSKQRKIFVKRFTSGRFLAINQDVFWWVFCDRFVKTGSGNIVGKDIAKNLNRNELQRISAQCKSTLFDRIAKNYTGIVFKQPSAVKEIMLNNFWDSLAQFVFFSFVMAYPKSKSLFTIEMKHYLVDMLAEWVVGMRTTSVSFDHWSAKLDRKKTVKLVAKLIDESQEKKRENKKEQALLASPDAVREQLIQNQQSMTLPGIKNLASDGGMGDKKHHLLADDLASTPLSDPRYHPLYQQRVLKHSLLIQRFLDMHNCRSLVENKQCCFTESPSRPLCVLGNKPTRTLKKVFRRTIERLNVKDDEDDEEEEEIAGAPKTIETYADVAKYMESKRKHLLNMYKKEKAKIRAEMTQIQNATKRECEQLRKQRQVALRGDVPEYSNFLVSSRAIEKE